MVSRDGRIAVVGGGAWGTALAVHLARTGSDVRWWVREPEVVARIASHRDNPSYLPGVRIPDGVVATDHLAAALDGAGAVVGVVPAQFARAVYRDLRPHLADGVPLVLASKGIEEGSLALPTAVAADVLGSRRPLAVLSGPSFAEEVARDLPTAVVVASVDADLARGVQRRVSSGSFRAYTNDDPVGVQTAGAVKNVMAIAAGVVDGLGMGRNAVAAVVTRGLAEITRLGLALGGRAETFSGLAGIGDLLLTCTGGLSRNREVGRSLARGERLEDILSRTRSVAEGIRTTESTRELARRHGVDMPIVEEVHRVLFEDGSPAEAVVRLMSRPLTSEDRSRRSPAG